MKRASLFVLVTALSFLFFNSEPVLAGEARQDLEKLKERMEQEKQGIRKVRKKEGSILGALQKVEEALDRKNRELKKTRARLESLLGELQKLEEDVKELNLSLAARRDMLERRAKAFYRWHRGGSPLVVLSEADSVSEVMRRKRFLELMLAEDRKLIHALVEEAARQEELKRRLAGRREELDGERRRLMEVKESIRSQRRQKKEILASLRREKEARVSALKELELAALRLQKMVDDLKQNTSLKIEPSGIPFGEMRGRLHLPVRGEVVGGFGKVKHPEFSEEIFRKGIEIQAPLGEEVKAVEDGRVVFADKFSGYGRMMIIDHGSRFFTVYAHLSELLKNTGEPVAKGESIAQVGDSDSLTGVRLYFEIRKDGKPIDPLPWFRKR